MTDLNSSIILTVRLGTSIRFTIPKPDSGDIITPNSTIARVKTIIAKEEACGNCAVERQRLIYKGRILSDDTRTLADYGLTESNQNIHLVKGSANSTSSNNTNTPASNTTSSHSTNTTNANPFMMMQQMMSQQQGDQSSMFPNIAQTQQLLQQNPDMLSNIMQSPMMQGVMSNPDLIRSMMESNPEMRRVMDQNPQLRAVLDDPEMMRRSMEMMRDPASMQNMMRNQELAMSQIENLPGGFNALRRMYEDVQEPMMDAMSGMGAGTSNSSSQSNSSSASSAGADGAAMPNPWGSSTSRSTPSSNATSTSSNTTASNVWNGSGSNTNPWASLTPGSGLAPGNMNIEQTISMLENPVINNMMQQMMSDPTAMEAIMNANPMMQQIRQANPAAAAMLSNPEALRSMLDPSNLRAMMGAQQAMQNMGLLGNNGAFPMNPGDFQNSSTTMGSNNNSNGNSSGLDFSSLLNPSSQSLPPEQRFQTQLTALNDMGFTDREKNLRALTACNGNVNRAVERLLSEN